MRTCTVAFIALISLGLGACSREDTDEAARKAGETAHVIAKKTEKALKKAGHEAKEAAEHAREGWQEADRKEREKKELERNR